MWRSSSVSGVGKAEHWATALNTDGKKVFDKALPNSEDKLRNLHERLGEHGRVLVAVDQPATIGALAVAVAQAMGITVGYLPGLSMRRIADMTPGSAKTDALARQSVVVAGTDAAGVVLPHPTPASSSPTCAQRADVAAQDGGPGGWPTLLLPGP